MNLKEDPQIIEFLLNRNLKPHSEYQYLKRIKQYCQYTQLTPTELIEEAINEEEQGIRKPNRKIKKYMIGYINKLKNENKSPNYITTGITIIKTFYNEFEIELPRVRCNIKEQKELVTTTDIPTKEDIKKIVKYANIKYHAIILLMMSSGMGSSEIRHITLKDYIASLNITDLDDFSIDSLMEILHKKEKEVPTWSIRRYKTKMPYITFSSPESVKHINEYIEDRYSQNYPFTSIDDYLFETKGKHMQRKTISTYFRRLNDTAGMGYYKRQRFLRAHALRNFFASTLKNNGFDSLDSEWLIGHNIKSITDAYIKPNIHYLKMRYMDILPYLSIEEVKTRTVESDEYRELKEQYKKDSQKKSAEIENLTEKLEKLERRQELTEKLVNDQEFNNDRIKE